MMPDFLFDTAMGIKVIYIKSFGNNLQKLLVRIVGNYYKMISGGQIHEDVISKIMKEEYGGDKKKIDECTYFVYNRKQTIDTVFDGKYGKSGRFMSHLFKLIQKLYLDKFLDDTRDSHINELNKTMIELNKYFNKTVLYYYSKYDI